MVSDLGQLVATTQLDISPFMGNSRQLQTYLKGLDSSLKTLETSFKGQKNGLSGMKSLYAQMGSSLKGYQTLLEKQSQTFHQLKEEIGDVNNASSDQKSRLSGAQAAMMATSAKVAELQSRYKELGREIATQSSVFTRYGAGLTAAGGHLTALGDNLHGVGKALTVGVTMPIVAGAGYVVKAAMTYESAFAGVKKTVDETATTSYAKLSDSIRQLSKELPASASEIANVVEVAGQLGVSADDVMKFSKVAIDLGESTNLSAEEAATAIAKIGNITGLTAEEYQRYGSSLVKLGNSFATTERDILAMANRMAAAGTLAGLTNQEMLGLATAMSSVGIEAEAGGTAMTQTLGAIEKAVATGSDKLQGFADIAGVSAETFTSKWKTKPAEALQLFLKGLGELGNKGESATVKLDELGLSGIRQSNMLKSLGLASGKVAEAIQKSNQAWDDNKALTDEANKRYETTESKLKMLKNEITDVAIEFGGPLVDALRDGLEASKPFLTTLSDMAKAFSSLDKEQQQQIIKWGLIAAGAGPVFSLFGKGVGVIGSVFKGLGTVSSALGKLSGGVKTLSLFSKEAGVASAVTGEFAGSVGLLGNPATWGVLLGGAALIGGIALYEATVGDAMARTREWGVAVDKTQANELTQLKVKVDETNTAMTVFAQSKDKVEEMRTSVEGVKKAFDGLAGSINETIDKQLSKDIKLAEKLGLSDEAIADMKRQAEQVKTNITDMSNQVKAIYEKHGGDMGRLSEIEKDLVLRNQREMIDKQLEAMKFSNEEKKSLQAVLNNELDQLNSMQLEKVITNTDKMAEKEVEAYKKNKDDILSLMETYNDKESKAYKEARANLEALEADHTLKMSAYNDQWLKAQKARIDDMKANGESSEQIMLRQMDVVQEIMERYGVGQKVIFHIDIILLKSLIDTTDF